MTLSLYPVEQVYEEVAFVAYHFNWSRTEVLSLPHWERRRWCAEISRINEQMSDESSGDGGVDALALVASESDGPRGTNQERRLGGANRAFGSSPGSEFGGRP